MESVLTENKLIGLAWAVLDYDDAEQRVARVLESVAAAHDVRQCERTGGVSA